MSGTGTEKPKFVDTCGSAGMCELLKNKSDDRSHKVHILVQHLLILLLHFYYNIYYNIEVLKEFDYMTVVQLTSIMNVFSN